MRLYPAWAVPCQWEVTEERKGTEWEAPSSQDSVPPPQLEGHQHGSLPSYPLPSLLRNKARVAVVSPGGGSYLSLEACRRHWLLLCAALMERLGGQGSRGQQPRGQVASAPMVREMPMSPFPDCSGSQAMV